uniref:Uncharacterized protein n=1 Tax=Anguilla anguilla TaxID=7936 RepID=A0A0E9PKT4_ANGAN
MPGYSVTVQSLTASV